MHREDELDALLSDQVRGLSRRGVASPEIEPLLEAASRFDVVRDAMPSHTFAADLETRLMARMGQAPVKRIAHAGTPTPRRTSVFGSTSRITWGAVAAALLLTIGLGVFTAKAAPGAPLYAVRQFAQTLAGQALSSPTADPLSFLAQARADLAAYNSAIANGNEASALTALGQLRQDDARTADSIKAMSDGSARQSAQAGLDAFRQGAATDLRSSLAALDWQGRAQVTNALRAWGDASLVVTHARIYADTSSGQPGKPPSGSGTLLVEARGAGFAPGARIIVNGQALGEIISLSPTRVVARIPASDLESSGVVIGVENTDEDVALAPSTERDDHGDTGVSATPVGDHSGDHSGSTTGDSTTGARTPTPGESTTPGDTPVP